MRHLGDGATVTSSGDGIRLSKLPEPDNGPVPSVRLAVTSTVRDPVEVTVVEVVPDDVTAEDVVLSSSYRPRELAVEDGRLRFDAVVRPGETVEIVYGLRESADGDVCSLLWSPILERTARLETVDGGAAADDTADGGDAGETDDGDDATVSAEEGDAGRDDPAPGPAGRPENGATEPVGPRSYAGPSTGEASAAMTRGGAAVDDHGTVDEGGPDAERADGVAAGDAHDDIERRLAALDRQFHDLESFFDAAGGFLDDGELPRAVMADLADQRYSIERRYRAVDADLARLEADVERVVAAVSSDLTALEERLASQPAASDSGPSDSGGSDGSDRRRDRQVDPSGDD